jgi:hypothetical protein
MCRTIPSSGRRRRPERQPPFMVAGIGMSMFWAPLANVVLAAARPEEEGQASDAQNAIRELGGVFGIAVLPSVWSHYGRCDTGQAYASREARPLFAPAPVLGERAQS